ncbi:MAG: hypothetical protein ACKV2O_22565 [Acidimicrobiales bacterium]
MTAVLLILLLLALLLIGVGAVFVARRRPGLRASATPHGSHGPDRTDRTDHPEIDPFAVSEPWRRFLQHALHAQDQFRVTLRATGRGPLRDQLQDIGASLDAGVGLTWSTAQQGHRLSQARRRIDTGRLTASLDQVPAVAERDTAISVDHDILAPDELAADSSSEQHAIGQSLRAQLDAARRLDEVITSAEQQLRLLTTQLDEAVARAAELAARAGSDAALGNVAADITRVSDQLEALRLALEETDRL